MSKNKTNKNDLINYKQISLNNSFQAQFNDMRLRDLTDLYGTLKLFHALNQTFYNKMTVKKPYIFKLTKGGKSIIILGTNHVLPFDVYPKNLQKTVLTPQILFTEINILQEYRKSLMNEEKNNIHSKEPDEDDIPDWYYELSPRNQIYLVDLNKKLPQKEDTLKSVLFSTFTIGLNEVVRKYGMGMDYILPHLHIISWGNFDNVKGLESPEESLEFINSLSDYSQAVKLAETLDDYNRNGGRFASQEIIDLMKGYLDGRDIKDKNAKFNEFIYKRNNNWATKLMNHLDEICANEIEYSQPEISVAVGLSHLKNKGDLLDIMHKLGFEVKRTDLAGEFHPYDDFAF